MAKNKTVETTASVDDYVAKISDTKKRNDFIALMELFKKQSGQAPKMWGTGIVGYGSYDYKYESGHEGSAPKVALAARANAFSLYLGAEFDSREELLAKLGKHKTGKGCLYIQKLEDVDSTVLAKMIKLSYNHKKGK